MVYLGGAFGRGWEKDVVKDNVVAPFQVLQLFGHHPLATPSFPRSTAPPPVKHGDKYKQGNDNPCEDSEYQAPVHGHKEFYRKYKDEKEIEN